MKKKSIIVEVITNNSKQKFEADLANLLLQIVNGGHSLTHLKYSTTLSPDSKGIVYSACVVFEKNQVS